MAFIRKVILFFVILFSFVAAGYIASFITEILTIFPFFILKKTYCFILMTLLITSCIAPITQPFVIYLRAYKVRMAQHAPLAKRTVRNACSVVIAAAILLTGGWLIHYLNHSENKMLLVLMVGYAVSLFHILFLLIWNMGDSNKNGTHT